MANTFPRIHVTGPVYCWVRPLTDGGSDPAFLGTCEIQPQVKIQQIKLDVRNDKAGPSLPIQRVDNGEMAQIALALNYFSKTALSALKLGTIGLGRRDRWSRGKLVFGGQTFELWMVFDNALDPDVRLLFPGLEMGWYWPQVEIDAEDFARIGGGKDELKLLSLTAQPYLTPITGSDSSGPVPILGDQEWYLYSNEDAHIPAAIRRPQ